MRFVLLAVLVYGLFVFQTGLLPVGPDLVLLAVVAAALNEPRLGAAVIGLFAGLLFDLAAPATLGANMLGLGLAGYGAAAARRYFYAARWSMLLLSAAGLTLRWGIMALGGVRLLPPLRLAAVAVMTVGLAPLAELLLTWLLYRSPRSA